MSFDYAAHEQRIRDTDTDGLRLRWLVGRAALNEREPGALRLPNGRRRAILDESGMSPAELTYRMQLAELWPTEEQLFNVLNSFGSWHDIVAEAIPRERRRRRIRDEDAAAAARLDQGEVGPPLLWHADAAAWLAGLEPSSVDLLLTDPPFATEFSEEDLEAFVEGWLPLALSRLARTGRALIFTGPSPEEVEFYARTIRASGLARQQLFWHYPDTLGPDPTHTFKSSHQPIWHVRGPEAPPLAGERLVEKTTVHCFNMHAATKSARRHTWQKPTELARRLLSQCSAPGDVVVDPFAGTGTFPVTAALMGRRAMACEADGAMLEVALARGCERAELVAA